MARIIAVAALSFELALQPFEGDRQQADFIAALRDFDPAYVACGSWLCENSSARRARRNISKKLRATESNRAARTMFDTLSENCIFYISQLYEFSHRLGQTP
jgi:hypothetical protein